MAVYSLLVFIFNLMFYICLCFRCIRDVRSKDMYPCVSDENNRTICFCSSKGYTNCSLQNLTSLPRIPNGTIFLNLSRNNLTYLNITQLGVKHYTHIEAIDFSYNNLTGMDKKFFERFVNISYLNMEWNKYFIKSIDRLLPSLPLSICELRLGNMNLLKFQGSFFKKLNGSNLRYLDLHGNEFRIFNSGRLFQYLGNLSLLDLSKNAISKLIFSTSKSLRHLWLTENDLTDIPKLCRPKKKTVFPHLESLILNKNCIRKFKMDNINCLSRLQTLNLSDTRVDILKDYTFNKLVSLKEVSVQHMRSLTYVQPFAFHSKSLECIYLRDNRLQFYSPFVNIKTLFSGCPNLKLLDISSNFLGKLTNNHWKILLRGIPKLTYLDVSLNFLLFVPKAIPELLGGLNQLRMSNNGISTVPSHYFDSLTNLTHLFLNGNKITQLSGDQLPNSELKRLNLAFNPFVCDCNILWLTHYLKRHRSILSYFPEHYTCSTRDVMLENLQIPYRACLIDEITSVVIESTSVAVIVVLLFMSVIYRYRWRLRYLIHILNLNRRGYSRGHFGSGELPIDVYISCSDCDFDFVNTNIIERMETDGMTAFIAERDAIAGSMRISSILEKIDESRYVLLCLSNAFAQDHWCEYETCMAIERAVYEGQSMIIIILLEEIENVNFTNFIHNLLRKYDYIKWGRNEEAKSLFWRRLKDLIRQGNVNSSIGDIALLRITNE